MTAWGRGGREGGRRPDPRPGACILNLVLGGLCASLVFALTAVPRDRQLWLALPFFPVLLAAMFFAWRRWGVPIDRRPLERGPLARVDRVVHTGGVTTGFLVSVGFLLRNDIADDVGLRLLVAVLVAAPAIGCAWWGLPRVRATDGAG